MHQTKPLERLEGTAQSVTTFQELDSKYGMKLPALFHLCHEPLTEVLTREFDFFGMARRGIAPITYYLELSSTGIPLALGRPLTLNFSVELFRANRLPVDGVGTPQQRLLLDQNVTVNGFRRSGSDQDLGFDDGTGEPVVGGAFRLIQIFTRPMAPPGQRQVTEAPPEFGKLAERSFPTPLMMPPELWLVPEGYEPIAGPPAQQTQRVWGLGNTDINNHVTVTEYLRALEHHAATLLHLAGEPVRLHRMTRLRCIFKRPSLAGDVVNLEGDLYRRGGTTRLHAGIFKQQADGALEADPSVTGCVEGVFENGENTALA